MTYTCNHCQQSAEIDSMHAGPIPCGMCGQGVFIEEEKYRTEYCYTRQDVSMMMLDRGDELERLRNALLMIKRSSEWKSFHDDWKKIINEALNAEQGG